MAVAERQQTPYPGPKRKQQPSISLRNQVTLVIGLLSFFPNLILAMILFRPNLIGAGRTELVSMLPIFLWLLFLAFLSALLSFVLSRQLLKPLTDLGQSIAKLQRHRGTLTAARLKMMPTEPHEIRSLKNAFNNLFDEIDLEQSRRQSFMATLMHDLKTPLVAANHLLAVVRDQDNLSREERIDLVSQLTRENEALLNLVQKMVEAHKFEREDVELNRVHTSLSELAQRVTTRVEPLAQDRNITIELKGDAEAFVDVRELERALYNLVSNAVRYAKSSIVIEVFSGVMRLSDDGPGLPAPLEQLARPFNAQPVEIAGKTYTAGTGGLGLYIARRIIEAHQGRLVTEISNAKGTVLLIYLGGER